VLDGVPDQFDPVVQVQLAESVLHVVLHGAVGQHEPGGDLLVGPAGGDHAEDLGLAFGQPRRVRAVPGGRGGQPPELAEYERGEPGGEHLGKRVGVGEEERSVGRSDLSGAADGIIELALAEDPYCGGRVEELVGDLGGEIIVVISLDGIGVGIGGSCLLPDGVIGARVRMSASWVPSTSTTTLGDPSSLATPTAMLSAPLPAIRTGTKPSPLTEVAMASDRTVLSLRR
jgi:hypothetical protein